MKKIALALLILIYFIPAIGLSVGVHFCGGKISSVSFFESSKNKCRCGKMTSNKGCCKDYQKSYKLAETPNSISKTVCDLKINTIVHFFVFTYISLIKENAKLVSNSNKLPPDIPENSIYILNSIFRI